MLKKIYRRLKTIVLILRNIDEDFIQLTKELAELKSGMKELAENMEGIRLGMGTTIDETHDVAKAVEHLTLELEQQEWKQDIRRIQLETKTSNLSTPQPLITAATIGTIPPGWKLATVEELAPLTKNGKPSKSKSRKN